MGVAIALGIVMAGLSLWIHVGLPVNAFAGMAAFLGAGVAGFWGEAWWDARHTADERLQLQLRRARRRERFWRRRGGALTKLAANPVVYYGAAVLLGIVLALTTGIPAGVVLIFGLACALARRPLRRWVERLETRE